MNSEKIVEVNISQEMKNAFIDYAMSVIVSRALPDVRDGLKPVHRRILYAMHELGMTADKPYKKSARIVGEVIGKYHPHGDVAVYDTMVRMAQDFSYRYMLVDGHGNFGSIDGDGAAAMRYTEARMSKISMELLRDIQKETVDFGENYDGSEKEPLVLPSRFPNILVNGTAGIAVGMATNIPPHQLGEVIDGIVMLIDKEDVTTEDLLSVIKGPDFPTGAYILGTKGIKEYFQTGRGTIIMRAKAFIEEHNNKPRIIVEEIPYQVNKAKLIEKIAELVREKKIEGLTDLRDESDREGLRIVIELKRDANPQVVLNNLYKQTQMQTSFGVIMLALVDGEPKVLSIKEVLSYYLQHQQVVIRRRTEFDLKKAEARAHILEGLKIALAHLDEVIKLIRSSQTTEEARNGLIERFSLTYEQAQAILDMRLQRLTGLEREKIEEEYQQLLIKIAEFKAILADEQKIRLIIRDELLEIKEKYNDQRKSQISYDEEDIATEDLIPHEQMVISITHNGYIKKIPLDTYRSQRRGGRGITGMNVKEEDFLEHLFITDSHSYIMFFTSKGRVHQLKAYEVPELSRTAKGTPIINLLAIEASEKITAVIPVADYKQALYLFFVTRQGIVKKAELKVFENIRKSGMIAINLKEDDDLIAVHLTNGEKEVIIASKLGQAIRFHEEDVRVMGRTATGVKGIELKDDDQVIGFDIVEENSDILVVTTNGYGKRTSEKEYRTQSRGGKGIKTINVTKRNGDLIDLKVVNENDQLLVTTTSGMIIRFNVKDISTTGRTTQGVKLINIKDDDQVSSIAKIIAEKDNEE